MFRSAGRLPRRLLLSAAVAGAVAGVPDPSKLPIYHQPDPEIVLVESPSRLEQEIGVVRGRVTSAYEDVHAHVQGWVSKWIGVEHAVENRVKSIISPDEAVTPGLLYVGVATLTGSILARNRLFFRLVLPPAFLVLSANHFLPKTTHNLSTYLGSLEETYFPTLAQKHDVANAHTQMTWERVKEATQSGRDRINRGATVAVDKVQEVTGLKLKETLGWQQKQVEKVEKAVVHTKDAIVEKVAEKVHEAEKTAKDAQRKIVGEAEAIEKEIEIQVEAADKKVEKNEDVVKSL
ncbi:apolipo protein O-domain-containing protein [Gymnopilus junonius]|uniref:MICOS complex subunit n=1 Tax=Gymnopilus junonius TaxID=109634 RepID=A0A9P5NIL3_GYMJU|nr:apolipo protein O-domain-containing protein [Gymnopilus junonius]